MSPTAINELPERILSSHVRRRLLVLPEDPTDEEVACHWTFSEANTREVRRCRGEDNRRRFALQLCALRTYGRFVPNHATVPLRLLNYLERLIGAICVQTARGCLHSWPCCSPLKCRRALTPYYRFVQGSLRPLRRPCSSIHPKPHLW